MAWHNKNQWGYLKESTEAHDNAEMVMDILYSLGWGKAAVCAALGNFDEESGYNPWRWQQEVVLPVGDSRIGYVCGDNTGNAYGIFQSDPAANYIYRTEAQGFTGYAPNYSNQVGGQNDGTAQMHYLNWVCTNYNDGTCGGWRDNYLSSIPFAQFKAQEDLTTYTIAQLTKIFHDGYERSSRWAQTGDSRIAAANYWWTYFQGYTPIPPEGSEAAGAVIGFIINKKKKYIGIYNRQKGRWL